MFDKVRDDAAITKKKKKTEKKTTLKQLRWTSFLFQLNRNLIEIWTRKNLYRKVKIK